VEFEMEKLAMMNDKTERMTAAMTAIWSAYGGQFSGMTEGWNTLHGWAVDAGVSGGAAATVLNEVVGTIAVDELIRSVLETAGIVAAADVARDMEVGLPVLAQVSVNAVIEYALREAVLETYQDKELYVELAEETYRRSRSEFEFALDLIEAHFEAKSGTIGEITSGAVGFQGVGIADPAVYSAVVGSLLAQGSSIPEVLSALSSITDPNNDPQTHAAIATVMKELRDQSFEATAAVLQEFGPAAVSVLVRVVVEDVPEALGPVAGAIAGWGEVDVTSILNSLIGAGAEASQLVTAAEAFGLDLIETVEVLFDAGLEYTPVVVLAVNSEGFELEAFIPAFVEWGAEYGQLLTLTVNISGLSGSSAVVWLAGEMMMEVDRTISFVVWAMEAEAVSAGSALLAELPQLFAAASASGWEVAEMFALAEALNADPVEALSAFVQSGLDGVSVLEAWYAKYSPDLSNFLGQTLQAQLPVVPVVNVGISRLGGLFPSIAVDMQDAGWSLDDVLNGLATYGGTTPEAIQSMVAGMGVGGAMHPSVIYTQARDEGMSLFAAVQRVIEQTSLPMWERLAAITPVMSTESPDQLAAVALSMDLTVPLAVQAWTIGNLTVTKLVDAAFFTAIYIAGETSAVNLSEDDLIALLVALQEAGVPISAIAARADVLDIPLPEGPEMDYRPTGWLLIAWPIMTLGSLRTWSVVRYDRVDRPPCFRGRQCERRHDRHVRHAGGRGDPRSERRCMLITCLQSG